MSAAHDDPEYRRNRKIVRQQVNAAHRRGDAVPCGRCGGPIMPGQLFDVGHAIDVTRGGTHDLGNLRAEHRGENRSSGGKLGAKKTNSRRQKPDDRPDTTRWMEL